MNRLHELIRINRERVALGRKRNEGNATFAESTEARRLDAAEFQLKDTLLAELAHVNGMKLSRSFSPRSLAENRRSDGYTRSGYGGFVLWHHAERSRSMGFDHHRYMKKDGRAAAIVTQPYTPHWEEDCNHSLLAPLRVNMPPNPWAAIHNPGGCLFIVLTRQDFPPVEWLPDQLEFEVQNAAHLDFLTRPRVVA